MNKTKAVFIVLSGATPIATPAGLTPGSPSTRGQDHCVPLRSFPQTPSVVSLVNLGGNHAEDSSAEQVGKGGKPRGGLRKSQEP